VKSLKVNSEVDVDKIRLRREWVFLLLSGLFLGSLAMLNILGVSRFIDLSKYLGISSDSDFKFVIAVGVLAYPITFLCTDLISELFGRKKANMVVWVGFILNLWVLLIMWLGGWLNAPDGLNAEGLLELGMKENQPVAPHGYAFYEIRRLTFGATLASMIAYLSAQFVDVQIYHFLKTKTKGKMLWLRNNASTLTSQLIDSIAVILITHYFASALPIEDGMSIPYALFTFIISSYIFKVFFALFDTIPMYLSVSYLKRYLDL
jgi:uncharacterized PurR-regulated membrane protein YhhQ (DUF165 family)